MMRRIHAARHRAVLLFLADLEAEALDLIDQLGGFRGRVLE